MRYANDPDDDGDLYEDREVAYDHEDDLIAHGERMAEVAEEKRNA